MSKARSFDRARGLAIWPTDRKSHPQSPPSQYALHPHLSSTTLCYPKPTINFRSKTDFVWCSQRFDARNKRKMHNACNPDLAAHTTHRTKPAPASSPTACRKASHVSKILLHHLLRHPPLWPPAQLHHSLLHSATTSSACSRHASGHAHNQCAS